MPIRLQWVPVTKVCPALNAARFTGLIDTALPRIGSRLQLGRYATLYMNAPEDRLTFALSLSRPCRFLDGLNLQSKSHYLLTLLPPSTQSQCNG